MTPVNRALLIDSLRSAFVEYVGVHLAAADDEQKKLINQMFSNHMNLIADYCEGEFFEKDTLTTQFIRGLHKIISPSGETLWKKNAKGESVAYMIPGQYKTEPNEIMSYLEPGVMRKFIEPSDTKKAMEELVQKYTNSIKSSQSSKEQLHTIVVFFIEFMKIHPFGDMNGRMAYILLDILLIKNNFSSMKMSEIRLCKKTELYKSIEMAQWKEDYQSLMQWFESVI